MGLHYVGTELAEVVTVVPGARAWRVDRDGDAPLDARLLADSATDIEFLLVAELVFFSGTMDCGKSTLALQMDHNHRVRGRAGLIFTRMDRAGESVLSSRLGLSTAAHEVTDDLDFWDEIVGIASSGHRVDYLICDEAQFYTPVQVEQLARLVDEMSVSTSTRSGSPRTSAPACSPGRSG